MNDHGRPLSSPERARMRLTNPTAGPPVRINLTRASAAAKGDAAEIARLIALLEAGARATSSEK
jgi:hypothetical protein